MVTGKVTIFFAVQVKISFIMLFYKTIRITIFGFLLSHPLKTISAFCLPFKKKTVIQFIMDRVIAALHIIMLICCPVAICVIIAKLALIVKRKGWDMQAFVLSFFRIYTTVDKQQTTGRRWRRVLTINNRINYFLYFFIVLFLFVFLIYGSNTFSF